MICYYVPFNSCLDLDPLEGLLDFGLFEICAEESKKMVYVRIVLQSLRQNHIMEPLQLE